MMADVPVREGDNVLILSGAWENFPATVVSINAETETALVIPDIFTGRTIEIKVSNLAPNPSSETI